MQNRLFFTLQHNRCNFIKLTMKSHPQKVKELSKIQQLKMQEMHLKYNHLLKRNFQGKIAYTLSTQTPEEMIKTGGFKKNYTSLWLNSKSLHNFGHNSGCVCFSLLPELTALFRKHNKPNFIYAVSLCNENEDDNLLLSGSKWREIISPGAFPIPNDLFFVARELLEIKANGQLNLGPLIGRKSTNTDKNNSIIQGERFDLFCSNQLVLPEAVNQGDDYPLEFDIIDTPYTLDFQNEIEAHYQNLNNHKIN